MTIRIGQGFDVHPFAEGRPLILAGVTIPFAKGLAGHSDADVMIHALIDALMGAAGLGDIGQHFPEEDPSLRGIDSRIMLRHTASLLDAKDWQINNVDLTLLAEAPKIARFKPQMIAHLAADLGVDDAQVGIKATTTEKLGFVGREEGMVCLAIACLTLSNKI